MNKRAIVNFADSRGWYPNGQARLIESCKTLFSGDLFTFSSYDEIGSPTHDENPYAFKIYAIEKVMNMGYDSILYLDSSIYPVREISAVFDFIEENGHLFQICGHPVDNWCNENCRNYFNLSREESKDMGTFSAGFTGLNFKNEVTQEFFKLWKESAEGGAFKGSWSDHRHDLTCASIIANRLKMHIEVETWFSYIGPSYNPPRPDTYFWAVPC